MELRVKCSCGSGLKLSEKMADKVIKCPKCAKKFRVPLAKFQAKAAQGGAPATPARKASQPSPAPAVAALDPIPVNLDDELLGDVGGGLGISDRDLLSAAEHQNSAPAVELPPPPVVPVGMPVEAPAELGYAQDPVRMKRSTVAAGVVAGPARSFWRDLVFAFIFPFATVGNAMNTLFVLVANVVAAFSCFGLFVEMYMAAVYMNIVSDTASGSEEYKAASLEGGLWDAVIRPFLRYVGTGLIALSPMWAYLTLLDHNVFKPSLFIFTLWTGAGIFLWPILMLLASLEILSSIFAIHRIFETIAKTILPYLAIWLMLLVALMMMVVSLFGASVLANLGLNTGGFGASFFGVVGGRIAGEVISTYLMLVTMRLVGLYYLHCKHKFTFKLE